jgi:hypothetical protein
MDRMATGMRRVFPEEHTATNNTSTPNYNCRYKLHQEIYILHCHRRGCAVGKVTNTSGKNMHVCMKYILNLFC